MKLLFITNTCPLPATNGLTIRSSSLLRVFHAGGHSVDLLCFGEANRDSADEELSTLCRNVHIIPASFQNVSSPGHYFDRLKKLPLMLPYGVFRYRRAEMREALRRSLTNDKYDFVICDTIDSVIHLPAVVSVPIIVNNHNVEHLILERYLRFESNLAKKAYGWIEAQKVRRWEKIACNRGAQVWVCSKVDQQVIEDMCPGVTVHVIPNAVDTDAYAPCDELKHDIVLYTGGMDWFPNRDAVEFFATQVLPRLRESVPGVRFVVAGRGPSTEFRRRMECAQKIEFTGLVPDMRTELARGTVCVVPLRIGSGTRLKILEAAAMQRPIVSTRLGAEGLEFVEEKEISIADDPSSFADKVASLLKDPRRRLEMGRAARRRVEEQYSFDVLQSIVEAALSGAARQTVTAQQVEAGATA